jgi:phage terminase large subunit-like protein
MQLSLPKGSERSPAEWLASLPEAHRAKILTELSDAEAKSLRWNWRFWARPKQIAPPGKWVIWLIMAGRGFGKTRLGAEWIRERVNSGKSRRIALVAETAADARDVMVEGESGLLSCFPASERPIYQPSKRRVTFANGAIATTYSAEEPDQLRGPQHDTAWCDEPAKWRYPEAWDQLMFGLRSVETDPRCVATTTPKAVELILRLVARAGDDVALTTGTTFENRANLAQVFINEITRRYAGTHLGEQELEGKLIEDAKGALWHRGWIRRVARAPAMKRIVVAVDPSVSADTEGAATGIVAAGVGVDGRAYVLADGSLDQPTPDQWANAVVALFEAQQADRIVVEVNQGGDLVRANLQSVKRFLPITEVHATRGKAVRAEPIAALYEQGRVSHVGTFALLEDELCKWEPNSGARSPNRLDALVWAMTELYPELTLGPVELSAEDAAVQDESVWGREHSVFGEDGGSFWGN